MVTENLKLGNKYLLEENYEEAVVAFIKAIEIDSRNVDGYIGLADAYIGLGDIEAAMDILEKGYAISGEERLVQKGEELQKEIDKEEEKPYVRRYDDTVYENLMEWLCLHGEYFNNVEEIEDISSYFHIFIHWEYDLDEMDEKWYDPAEQIFKIPGEDVRRIVMKYLDFQTLDLAEKMPAYTEMQTGGFGYDETSDTYYSGVLGGMGDECDHITSIDFEVLDTGLVKATAHYILLSEEEYQETVVVREEENQVLKLISFMGEGLQGTDTSKRENITEFKEQLDVLEQKNTWDLVAEDFWKDIQSIDLIGMG